MKKKKFNEPWLIRATRWLFPKLERVAPFLAHRIFRLVFYVPVKYPVPEKEKEAVAQSTLFAFQVAGKKVQAYRWGDEAKPYVLVVHGWAGRATQFRKFIKPLNDTGFQVIGFDGPAHGQSEGRSTSILEFEQVLNQLFSLRGVPVAVVTHSFGGAAVLYATRNGLPVKTLVNIASPSIADEILKTYMRAINASWKSAEKFKEFVKRKSGKNFEEFTALQSVKNLLRPIDLLIVQDENDDDVLPIHAEELKKAYPSAQLLKTSGLGHNRILKDDQVIAQILAFISARV